MKNQKFNVSGMMCTNCQAHVENAVNKLDGVDIVCVNLLANTMDVSFDEEKLNNKTIIKAVKAAGYGAKEFSRDNSEYDEDSDKTRKRLILSVILLIPLMFIAMSHMFGLHIDFLENMTVLGIAQMLFLVPILILNRKYFVSGVKSILGLSPNMDALIALGAGISVAYSLYNFVLASINSLNIMQANSLGIHYYFESAAMILTFITVGKYL